MLEKFNVVKVRFHIEDAGILVIQGFKYQMTGAETLAVKDIRWHGGAPALYDIRFRH